MKSILLVAVLGLVLTAPAQALAASNDAVHHRHARSSGPQHARSSSAQHARSSGAQHAHSSGAQHVNDHGKLRFHTAGATVIVDEGPVSGSIPGHAIVHFAYNGSPNVTARFAIHAKGGVLYGKARCKLHNPTSPVPSYSGALQITGGSGRYAHAHGSGEMYGLFYRHGYALVVHANGTLRR